MAEDRNLLFERREFPLLVQIRQVLRERPRHSVRMDLIQRALMGLGILQLPPRIGILGSDDQYRAREGIEDLIVLFLELLAEHAPQLRAVFENLNTSVQLLDVDDVEVHALTRRAPLEVIPCTHLLEELLVLTDQASSAKGLRTVHRVLLAVFFAEDRDTVVTHAEAPPLRNSVVIHLEGGHEPEVIPITFLEPEWAAHVTLGRILCGCHRFRCDCQKPTAVDLGHLVLSFL